MKIVGVLFFLIPFSLVVQAQECNFTGGVRTDLSFSSPKFKPFEVGIDLGYYVIHKLFVSTYFESSVGLFKREGVKTYRTNETLGVGLGYNILSFDGGVLDIRGKYGTTLENKDWKYTYYDAGVFYNLGKQKVKPTFGVGVRYYDSKNSHVDDYLRVYASLGFKFN